MLNNQMVIHMNPSGMFSLPTPQGFMAPTILLATLVSFVADVSLEVLLVTSVGEAAVAVATVKAELLVLGWLGWLWWDGVD